MAVERVINMYIDDYNGKKKIISD